MHRTTLGLLASTTLLTGLVVATPHLASGAPAGSPALRAGEKPVRTLTVPLVSRLARVPGGSNTASTRTLTPGAFSQVAVTWHGDTTPQAEVRTRSGGRWGAWTPLEPLTDLDAGEGDGTAGSELLWTGPSDAVQVRTRGSNPRDLALVAVDPGVRRDDRDEAPSLPEGAPDEAIVPTPTGTAAAGLVSRELAQRARDAVADAVTDTASPTVSTATDTASPTPTATTVATSTDHILDSPPPADFPSHHAPRPAMYNRAQWGADESLRNDVPHYSDTINSVHIHHTVSINGYTKSQVPAMIRGMYSYHTQTLGWADIGYNFLVDKYGRVWEGRAGGVNNPVRGAHTLGFNWRSVGIAVIGNHSNVRPSSYVMTALVKTAAWKLDLYGRWPAGYTWTVSEGSDKYADGKVVRLHTIDGHRDTNDTACPGWYLYVRLSDLRKYAAQRASAY